MIVAAAAGLAAKRRSVRATGQDGGNERKDMMAVSLGRYERGEGATLSGSRAYLIEKFQRLLVDLIEMARCGLHA
jgi:hypothetical protein